MRNVLQEERESLRGVIVNYQVRRVDDDEAS